MEFAMRYQELCRKQKADQYALVFMDSVDFKQINETLGAEWRQNAAIFLHGNRKISGQRGI